MEYVLIALLFLLSMWIATWFYCMRRGIRFPFARRSVRTRVKSAMGENNPKRRYIINNLIIKTEDEGIFKTTYIDHVLINERGVFVVEAKTHYGRIYGNDSQLEWCEAYNFGRTVESFYNPVMQNQAHLYFVSVALPEELREVPLTSAVVFSGCNIKGVKSDSVYTIREFKGLIRKGEKILSPDTMKRIYECLSSANGVQIKVCDHEENLRLIRRHIELGKCPSCGRELAIRTGRYGEFLACPNYPRCTFTRRI